MKLWIVHRLRLSLRIPLNKKNIHNKYFQEGQDFSGEDHLPNLFSEVGNLFVGGVGGGSESSFKPEGKGDRNPSEKENKSYDRDWIVES